MKAEDQLRLIFITIDDAESYGQMREHQRVLAALAKKLVENGHVSIRLRITRLRQKKQPPSWDIKEVNSSKQAKREMDAFRQHIPVPEGRALMEALAGMLLQPDYDVTLDVVRLARWSEAALKRKHRALKIAD